MSDFLRSKLVGISKGETPKSNGTLFRDAAHEVGKLAFGHYKLRGYQPAPQTELNLEDRIVRRTRWEVKSARSEFLRDFSTDDLESLELARDWRPGSDTMSGAEANATITETYHSIDQAMTTYLGPIRVPNWATFGKYASYQAGASIANLEDAMSLMKKPSLGSLADLVKAGLQDPSQAFKQAKGMFGAGTSPDELQDNMMRLRDTMVRGNVSIIQDIAPAYYLFLRSEMAGSDGVQALQQAGFTREERDPQGLIVEAFRRYQEARRKTVEIAGMPNDTPIQTLRAKQDEYEQLVLEGNLLLGLHEQMHTLQHPEVFGDPEFARLMERFSGAMTIEDANGSYPLLPNGGNWSTFIDRMGLKEVPRPTSGSFQVQDHAGKVHHYKAKINGAIPKGTILHYFRNYANGGPQAERLIDTKPGD